MAVVDDIRNDLIAEQDALDSIVAALSADQWRIATASPRWTVADQIAHLTYFDRSAALAISDPGAFDHHVAELAAAVAAGEASTDDATLGEFRAMTPAALLATWRSNRALLAEAAASLGDDARVAWYGPSMGARSFLTARLMECWAHGQDVVDAVGAQRPATDRLRHVAQLGFITRGWSYVNRGREAPAGTIRLELTAPSGERWTWGPDDADDVLSGDAVDFCLVVTQRRHYGDTALQAGPLGREWLEIAQAFAGPPTNGPAATGTPRPGRTARNE